MSEHTMVQPPEEELVVRPVVVEPPVSTVQRYTTAGVLVGIGLLTIWLFVLSIVVNIGMWLERFVIIATSLHRDFLPSSWGMYVPSIWDFAMFAGTIGLFLTLLFLFIRFLPVINIFEMRELLHETEEHAGGGHH